MGAVMKDNIVAILIKVPISDSKTQKIIIVTMDIIKNPSIISANFFMV